MELLIVDSGIYPINSNLYYEPFHIFNLLKDKYSVDIFKDRVFDKENGVQVKSFDEIIHKKYEIIISLNPLDFEYILRYIKISKYKPIVIFIDRFNFIQLLYNGKHDSLAKNFDKILKYTNFYLTTSKRNIKTLDRTLTGLTKDYIVPFVNERHFKETADKDDFSLAILFANEIDSRYTDLKTLIKAVDFIAKSNFAERNNFVIDIISNGIEKEKLKKMIHKKRLDEYFIFSNSNDYRFSHEQIRNHRFSIIVPRKYPFAELELTNLANGVPTLIDSNSFEFTENNKNGIVFESGNYVDLAEKIMLMLSTDLTLFKENAIKSTKNLNAKYNLKIMEIVNNAVNELKDYKYDEEIDSDI